MECIFITIMICYLIYLVFIKCTEKQSSATKDTTERIRVRSSPGYTRAVFVGCAKDIEDKLHHSLKDVVRLAEEFDDYVLLIYENDSSDKTVDVIKRFSLYNPRVKLISERNVPGTRTQRLAHGRNLLLTIAKEQYPEFDFLVVMDLDYNRSNTRSIYQIANTMPHHYSGVTAVSRNIYYDWWAFRSRDLNMDYDCHNKGKCHDWSHKWGEKINQSRRKVESAFNGIGIYRLSNIPDNAMYVGETPDGKEVCEHVSFHTQLSYLYIEPNLVTSTWDD